MKRKWVDLQLFADGGEGGTGDQGEVAGSGNVSQGAGYTYEQLEEIATSRSEKAGRAALADFFRKQGMDEDSITKAIADYKEKQKKSQPDVSAIERERDEAKEKLQQFENEKILTKNHVRADDLDYVMFKVEKLVTDKLSFEQAAEKFLKENPRYKEGGTYRVSSGADTGKSSTETGNEAINDVIRGAFGRK